MMWVSKRRVAILVVALPLLSGAVAFGQAVSRPAGRSGNVQQAQDRLIERFLEHATTELDLTAEQRDNLRVVLRETMDRRGRLARDQAQLRREIGEALSDPTTNDETFRRLSNEVLDVKRQEVELLGWQERQLLDVLTARQTLRFMLMQQQLARRIEDLRRERAGMSGEGQRR
jgi:hypothetical protein